MNATLLKVLMPVIVAFFWMLSFFLFLRGHNLPGGGFIAALCFCLGLLAFSFALESPKALFDKILPYAHVAIILGFICFLFSFLMPLLLGDSALEALWTKIQIPVAGKLSSVLVFDLGVYFIVTASVLFVFRQIFSETSND